MRVIVARLNDKAPSSVAEFIVFEEVSFNEPIFEAKNLIRGYEQIKQREVGVQEIDTPKGKQKMKVMEPYTDIIFSTDDFFTASECKVCATNFVCWREIKSDEEHYQKYHELLDKINKMKEEKTNG